MVGGTGGGGAIKPAITKNYKVSSLKEKSEINKKKDPANVYPLQIPHQDLSKHSVSLIHLLREAILKKDQFLFVISFKMALVFWKLLRNFL